MKRATEEQVNREENQQVTVAVLGLGNPVLGDDGVGLHVAAEVERMLREGPVAAVTVLTSTRGGFELISLLAGFTHAIIIDCLDIPQPVPGRIRLLDLNSLSGSARLVGVHDISVADALELAATIGTGMPGTVEIYAVEGGDTQTISEEMTHAVSAAVAPLARIVYARACEWSRDALPGFQ